MPKPKPEDGEPVIIKKYANRRLYNTQSSSYITLDDLSRMTREGVDFKVIDAKSGDELTHAILTQIIMEEETHGAQMLPTAFLRQLIGMYGHSMQAMIPQYLEAAMENFSANQAKWHDAMEQNMGTGVFTRMAETNLAMMRAATEAFIPAEKDAGDMSAGSEAMAERPTAPPASDELGEMRAQMAAMKKRLDELEK